MRGANAKNWDSQMRADQYVKLKELMSLSTIATRVQAIFCILFLLLFIADSNAQTHQLQLSQTAAVQNGDAMEDSIKSFIASHPNDMEGHLLLGDMYLMKGKLADAMSEYQTTTSLRHDFIAGYARMAFVLMDIQEDMAQAIRILEDGSNRNPLSGELHAILGHAYLGAAFQKTEYINETDSLLALASTEFTKTLQSAIDDTLRASIHLALGALYQYLSDAKIQAKYSSDSLDSANRALSHYSEALALRPAYGQELIELEAELAFPRPKVPQMQSGSWFEKSIRTRLQRLQEK